MSGFLLSHKDCDPDPGVYILVGKERTTELLLREEGGVCSWWEPVSYNAVCCLVFQERILFSDSQLTAI